jgi:hypothetical protein
MKQFPFDDLTKNKKHLFRHQAVSIPKLPNDH